MKPKIKWTRLAEGDYSSECFRFRIVKNPGYPVCWTLKATDPFPATGDLSKIFGQATKVVCHEFTKRKCQDRAEKYLTENEPKK